MPYRMTLKDHSGIYDILTLAFVFATAVATLVLLNFM